MSLSSGSKGANTPASYGLPSTASTTTTPGPATSSRAAPIEIALWMLDPDYDGRSLFPRQVFFPMAGGADGWARLARNLRAEIDQSRIAAYRGTVSLPFEPGEHKRAAIKIVDDRGIESLKVIPLTDVARS